MPAIYDTDFVILILFYKASLSFLKSRPTPQLKCIIIIKNRERESNFRLMMI